DVGPGAGKEGRVERGLGRPDDHGGIYLTGGGKPEFPTLSPDSIRATGKLSRGETGLSRRGVWRIRRFTTPPSEMTCCPTRQRGVKSADPTPRWRVGLTTPGRTGWGIRLPGRGRR